MPRTKQEVVEQTEAQREAWRDSLHKAAKGIMEDYEEAPAKAEQPSTPPKEEQPEAQVEGDEPEALEEAEDVGTEEPEPATPADASAEAEAAREEMRKHSGLTEKDIAALSDEGALAWSKRYSKLDKDMKAALRRAAEAERKAKSPETTAEGEPAVPTSTADPELERLLSEEIGEDAAKKVVAKFGELSSQYEKRLGAVTAALEHTLAERAYKDTVAAWRIDGLPSGTFEKVVSQASSLARIDGPWSDLQGEARVKALVQAAMRMSLDNIPSESERNRRDAISKAKRNGTATPNQQREATKPALTGRDRYIAAAEKVVFGKPRSG